MVRFEDILNPTGKFSVWFESDRPNLDGTEGIKVTLQYKEFLKLLYLLKEMSSD